MQALLLIYSVALVIAALLSESIRRSMLSASVLFLGAGILATLPVFGRVDIDPRGPLVSSVAEAALFAVLFTDGMKIGFRELAEAARLPGRALLFGMPLTIAGTALLAHSIAGLPWMEAFLLGAILSPTDPVLVSAIIGRQAIPGRLRRLLHIESGVNDGLALPAVIILISLLSGTDTDVAKLGGEILAGIGVGIAVPWAILKTESSRFLRASGTYRPLLPAAAALLVFSVCKLTHANEYLGAFAAGVTAVSISRDIAEEFRGFGEQLTELIKLGALLLFGALLSPRFFEELDYSAFLFATAALIAVRPMALGIALIGSPLPRPQFWAAAWFGPKGFASVTYSLLVLRSGIDRSDQIFHLAAVVVGISIVAHSSSDVPVAKRLARIEQARPKPAQELAGRSIAVLAGESVIKEALENAGAELVAVSAASDGDIARCDGLLLGGNAADIDRLRTDETAAEVCRSFVGNDKPVAAVAHGPALLVEAGVVRDRALTAAPSLRTDIINAGGDWQDQECVTDGGLLTARGTDNAAAVVEHFASELSEERRAA